MPSLFLTVNPHMLVNFERNYENYCTVLSVLSIFFKYDAKKNVVQAHLMTDGEHQSSNASY